MKHVRSGGGSGSPRRPEVDPLGTNSEIGRKLKQYYDGLVSDDVPDRFAALLGQLEQAEASQKPSKSEKD